MNAYNLNLMIQAIAVDIAAGREADVQAGWAAFSDLLEDMEPRQFVAKDRWGREIRRASNIELAQLVRLALLIEMHPMTTSCQYSRRRLWAHDAQWGRAFSVIDGGCDWII